MDATINIAQLEEAITLFYSATTEEQKIRHEWLMTAQTSPEAWQFAWQLMQFGKSQVVQFFGASTLHSKLMRFWHELPIESHDELKHKIFEAIIQFANGPKLVLNRLCIALGAFIIHMIGEWPTSIEDVINTFQNQQIPNLTNETAHYIMLEVLQSIPEELPKVFISVKRATIRGEISHRTPLVIQTIEAYLQLQLDKEWITSDCFCNITLGVKCANTWIKNIGYSVENCENITKILLKLIEKCYWTCIRKSDGDGCMSADETDLAEICLQTLQVIIVQPESHQYPKTVFNLLKMFLCSLCEITRMESKPDNNNEDIAMNIYNLFIASVERHSQMLLNGVIARDAELTQMLTRLICAIMECTNKPGIYPVEESCSNMSLGFWYLLQDEVFSVTDATNRGICWEYIKPVYEHMSLILIRKAELPNEDSIAKWNEDDLETFRCYRQDITDTLMYCYDVVHSKILDLFAQCLEKAIIDLQRDPTKWTKLEACIFAYQSLGEHYANEDNKHLSRLMDVLSEIPYENLNSRLLGTALETIGSFCLWLGNHPQHIPGAIALLVKGLDSPMSAQASLGLKDLCRDCQLQLKPYAAPLLDACQASLISGRLKNPDCVRLMFSVGRLMSLLPMESISNYLNTIVGPCFEELQILCQNKTLPNAKIRTIYRLNMISTLFSSLNTDLSDDDEHPSQFTTEKHSFEKTETTMQPVLLVMQKTMPIFRQIAEVWINETEVLESACSALKHAIVNLRASFEPMLQDLCCFIVPIFQAKCCTPTLEIAKTVIILFYKDNNCKPLMSELLVQFTLHTFRVFENTPESNLSEIADICDTFYGCLMQIIKKLPEAFNNINIQYDKFIQNALKSMKLPENGPIRSSIQAISHFILQSKQFPMMTQSILDHGYEIVSTALLCVGCITPRQQVEKFADIFLSLNKKYPMELGLWLKTAMEKTNLPSALLNEQNKLNFLTQIVREKTNKRLLQQHLSQFAILARGLSDNYH